jgi:gamma-D-glutamyl-L-lysine dipeptidyl-peptidase
MDTGGTTFEKTFIMNQGICMHSVIPLRKEPDHRSEQVNQLLFGERVNFLKKQNGWQQIEMFSDAYSGWVEEYALHPITDLQSDVPFSILSEPFTEVFTNDHPIYLPAGSEIPLIENQLSFSIENRIFKLGKPLRESDKSVTAVAMKFMHAPYQWGGRTIFGIDCSGLVQLAHKIQGINLPRDAKEQAKSGHSIKLNEATAQGDLFFFGEDPQHISHVGINLGDCRIIHASKSVRIDLVDEKGIFNNELKRYTHHLQLIRRVVL